MKNSRNFNGKLNIIGDKIKFYRIKNKLSYQKLSDKLMLMGIDIHKQALYRIEHGQRTIVDYELFALAKCLNISLDDLLVDCIKRL